MTGVWVIFGIVSPRIGVSHWHSALPGLDGGFGLVALQAEELPIANVAVAWVTISVVKLSVLDAAGDSVHICQICELCVPST